MIDKLKKALQQATDAMKEQANAIGDSAVDRTYRLFEQWAVVFPKLEEYGLTMRSFGISVTLSPSMEVVLQGEAKDFSKARVDEILAECKGSTILSSVFRTIKSANEIRSRAKTPDFEDMYVKILVKIPPEVKVVFGEQILL